MSEDGRWRERLKVWLRNGPDEVKIWFCAPDASDPLNLGHRVCDGQHDGFDGIG